MLTIIILIYEKPHRYKITNNIKLVLMSDGVNTGINDFISVNRHLWHIMSYLKRLVLSWKKPNFYSVVRPTSCDHFKPVTCNSNAEDSDQSLYGSLKAFGAYVHECLPKFVEKVQFNHCRELEIMITPEGILPTMQVLGIKFSKISKQNFCFFVSF